MSINGKGPKQKPKERPPGASARGRIFSSNTREVNSIMEADIEPSPAALALGGGGSKG